MEDKRADYNITVEDLGKRTQNVSLDLKRQVAKKMAKEQAKEEMEIGGK